MVNSTEDHCPILGQNVCPIKKATMYSEKFTKGYVGLMKPKTPSSKKLYCKVTTGLICQRTPLNSYRNAPSVSSLLDSLRNPPTFSIQLEVHGPLPYGEWTS